VSTFLFTFSAILFIGTFGMHATITNGHPLDRPRYTYNPIASAIPWISGFILPIIPLALVLDINWIVIFIFNMAVVYFFGPPLTNAILVRFASGKGIGYDMIYSFIGGFITLILGLLFL